MRQIPEDVKAEARLAHEAIHDPTATFVVTPTGSYPIVKHRNGCRMVKLGPYTVIEQNKLKNTVYAKRAKAGERLSWIIPNDPSMPWHLVEDETKDV